MSSELALSNSITSVITDAAALAAIIAAYEFFLFMRKYAYRPQARVGILPVENSTLASRKPPIAGTRSPGDEFHFSDVIFAKRARRRAVPYTPASALTLPSSPLKKAS